MKPAYFQNQKAAVPLVLIIALVGFILFLLIASFASFRSQLFASLFPKPLSEALVTPPITGPVVLRANLDGDRDVDLFDYNLIIEDYGKTGTGLTGDVDKDGDCDLFDFNILIEDYGQSI